MPAEDLEATDRGLLGSSAAPSSPSSTGTRNFFFKLPSISNMDCMLWLVFIRLPPRDVAGSFWSPSQLVLSRSSWSKLKSSPPGSARGKGCTWGGQQGRADGGGPHKCVESYAEGTYQQHLQRAHRHRVRRSFQQLLASCAQ